MAWDIQPVDIDGAISLYYAAQNNRTRQIAAQKEMERADRKEQRGRDFDDAYGRFIGAGGLAGAFGGGRTPGRLIEQGAGSQPSSGLRGVVDAFGQGAGRIVAQMPSRLPTRGNLMPIDPNSVSGAPRPQVTLGSRSPDPRDHMMTAVDSADTGTPENLLPPEIERMAASPNMDDRNAAFMEMARIDPKRAFQIQSDARDAALDRLKGGQDALRIAASRLASTNDDNSYRAVLADLDAQLMPLGIDISKTVPTTHPGPEGIRKLQMLAMKEAEQLAALDREARTEAMIENYEADNARADRNTDSLIAERGERTGIQRQRAETAAERERRLGAGGGRGGRTGGAAKTAVNPETGERLELRNGKWVPVKGGASGNAGGRFR